VFKYQDWSSLYNSVAFFSDGRKNSMVFSSSFSSRDA